MCKLSDVPLSTSVLEGDCYYNLFGRRSYMIGGEANLWTRVNA